MYVGDYGTREIYQWSLSTAWDVTTATYDTKSMDTGAQDTNLRSVSLNDDGSRLYIVGLIADSVYQYSLSTPWDVSTGTYDSKYKSVTNEDTSPRGLFVKDDGAKFYIAGTTNDKIFQYTMEAAVGTNMKINIGDDFKDVDAMKINIGDTWKDVVAVKQNIGDAWKDVF